MFLLKASILTFCKALDFAGNTHPTCGTLDALKALFYFITVLFYFIHKYS